jgi:hypothetical protein
MKKIITLICLVGMMQGGFAKDHYNAHWWNFTQNSLGTIDNWNAAYCIANMGDSMRFSVYIDCYPYSGGPSQWFFNGDSIPNMAGLVYLDIIVNQYGTIAVPLGACFFDSVRFHLSNTTAISSLNNLNSLNVFPTTVTSTITIQLNSIKTNDIEISFFDMNGKELKNNFYKNIIGELIKNENTEALAKGIYFLRIKTGDDVVERKFVKM